MCVFVLCLYTSSSRFKHSLLTFDQPSSTVLDAHLQGKYTRCPPPPPPPPPVGEREESLVKFKSDVIKITQDLEKFKKKIKGLLFFFHIASNEKKQMKPNEP